MAASPSWWAWAGLVLLMVVASVGCGGRLTPHAGSQAAVHAEEPGATATPHAASAPAATDPSEPSRAAPTGQDPFTRGGASTMAPAASDGGPTVAGVAGATTAAYSADEPATVEELLEEGLHRAGASPVHLAIRGTPAADSVRCAWRGIARTSDQRADAIRFWLSLGATDAIPAAAYLETLFAVVFDTLAPDFRETAKANFLAIARGGESMDYLFLTCFADYAVTNVSIGDGYHADDSDGGVRPEGRGGLVRPVRAGARHAARMGRRRCRRGATYEAGLQAQVVAAEEGLECRDRRARGGGVPGADGGAPRDQLRGLAGGGLNGPWSPMTTMWCRRCGTTRRRAIRSTRRRWPT